MTGGEDKSFWDRFDIHTKRWQTVAAGIVAVGAIVGFTGNKIGWHWPESWGRSETAGTPTTISTAVRYQSNQWLERVDMTGRIDPVLEVQIRYINTTDDRANNVVINLDYPPAAQPVKGAVQLKNSAHPDAVDVGDGVVNGTGMNIGDYMPKANAYVRIPFMITTSQLPCGENTLVFRSYSRAGTMDMDKATYSNEAVVAFDHQCDKP